MIRMGVKMIKPFVITIKNEDKGHGLFLHNYYMSLVLVQYLLGRQTKVVRTVRPTRRNFPHEVATASFEKGDSKFVAAHTGMLIVK